MLVDGLPPVAVVKSGSEQAAVLSWALRRLAHELAHASPGGAIVIQHLGHIMLVEMLRLYLERGGDGAPSWLLAVSDPRAAIQAIHADPARVWTVEALAEVAGVSRSTLAAFQAQGGHRAAGILAALAHATGGARADRQPGDDFLGRAEAGL